jgi:hypothetical protein
MAGIENIVVHSKVGVTVVLAIRLIMCQLLTLLRTVLPRPLDPGPRVAFDFMERSAA